uniref:hypothetical protein n=1 Tax=Fibrocapsa japonica TaxID=94617 RepID=UPI002113FAF2|nr:hypothetical protein NQZ09_pgp007 [Fibrocapsa japonica]UTE95089.1 hypothetical protein FjapPt_p007 [Fibrocapsa japonica]
MANKKRKIMSTIALSFTLIIGQPWLNSVELWNPKFQEVKKFIFIKWNKDQIELNVISTI